MIRIKSLVIHEFRGIRRLSLDLDEENFVVCGPNGTGKSGVVDAIEFALTGDITRLSGRGTGKISVKDHAPHVDSRNNPDSARVLLTVTAPSLQKTFTIERRVKQPRVPQLTPDSPDIRALVATLELHPEFALSRREIIKYIMVEPGQRAKDVQALLRLNKLEAIRALLVRITNSAKREAAVATSTWEAARQSLRSALGIAELREGDILREVNERRTLLGLAPITALTASTSFRDGLATADSTKAPALNKATAVRDIDGLRHLLSDALPEHVAVAIEETRAALQVVAADAALLRSILLEPLLRKGLELVADSHCPLCDTDWHDAETLRAHINEKLSQASAGRAALERLRKATLPIAGFVESVIQSLARAREIGERLQPKVDTAAIVAWSGELRVLSEALTSAAEPHRLGELLLAEWRVPPAAVTSSIDGIHASVSALPDASAQDDARTYLVVADERRAGASTARLTAERWKRRHALAQKVQEIFVRVSDAASAKLYHDVEADFVSYYVFINQEDESQFTAQLQPSVGKLGFDVDFYGRGLFPPGAYHSEGHQDAMGLCLYLALMKHTLGDDFTFAVLDDVLMSIDAGHRREVCRLLREKFASTQFVITTHDEAWRQFMISESLVKPQAGISFRKWTVEDGPQVGVTDDIWKEIQEFLDSGQVPPAAAALRRDLEYIFTDLATKLRARLELRGDNRYELGELLPAAVGKWGDLLGQAKTAAQSWGDAEAFKTLGERHDEFKSRLARTNAEEWAINATVHYNTWANLSPEEFAQVVSAFQDLVEVLSCPGACKSLFHVEPRMGRAQATEIRCNCGHIAINLNRKAKGKKQQ
jgi:hypothetical protein